MALVILMASYFVYIGTRGANRSIQLHLLTGLSRILWVAESPMLLVLSMAALLPLRWNDLHRSDFVGQLPVVSITVAGVVLALVLVTSLVRSRLYPYLLTSALAVLLGALVGRDMALAFLAVALLFAQPYEWHLQMALDKDLQRRLLPRDDADDTSTARLEGSSDIGIKDVLLEPLRGYDAEMFVWFAAGGMTACSFMGMAYPLLHVAEIVWPELHRGFPTTIAAFGLLGIYAFSQRWFFHPRFVEAFAVKLGRASLGHNTEQ